MEKEKMLSGQLYDPSDEELTVLRTRARKLARRYNNTDEDNVEELQAIINELVPNKGEGTFFQAPVYFDYGCFVTFGKRCAANFNLTVLDCCPITIGDNVLFGPNCTLAAPMHPLCPKERNVRERENGELYNLEYAKPITIGNDCWFASNVTVCGGVMVGDGCVIGAGSVVTRNIPPYSLAVGNPCRVIRQITDADLLEKPVT